MLEEGERRLQEAAKQARTDRLAEQERRRQAELERQRIAKAIEEHWIAFKTVIQAEDLSEAASILSQVRDLNPEEPGLGAGEQRWKRCVLNWNDNVQSLSRNTGQRLR